VRKTFVLAAVFAFGYVGNDVFNGRVSLLASANAEVAGMDHRDLRRDSDFKKAVIYIVEDCDGSGYVDGDYVYSLDLSC
jgi:hypothetical protein